MPAFNDSPVSSTLNCLREHAEKLNCNPCFDSVFEDAMTMNEKGNDGVLYCLCKVGTPCPCDRVEKDLEKHGKCYCGIFRRVEV